MDKKIPIKQRLAYSLNERDKANVWKALFKYVLDQNHRHFNPLYDKHLP